MFPDREHHVLRPQQPYTVSVRLPRNLLRQLRQRDVHVDSRRGNRNDSRNLLAHSSGGVWNGFDECLIDKSPLFVNSVIFSRLPNPPSGPPPAHTRDSPLPRNKPRQNPSPTHPRN